MSALARWFVSTGRKVAGYDRTATQLTRQLAQEGMEIVYDERDDVLPDYIIKEKSSVLVVYTPAVPLRHPQWQFFKQEGFMLMKRSAVLGEICQGMPTIAVAGTHGKTTTSSLAAHILFASGVSMTAILGGVLKGYESNYIFSEALSSQRIMVTEADEYDRSFLALHPMVSIVTSADADHLDIYGTHADMIEAYQQFVNNTMPGGTCILHENVRGIIFPPAQASTLYYGASSDVQAKDVHIAKGSYVFTYKDANETIEAITLHLPGIHNVDNTLAAIAAVLATGKLNSSAIKEAIGCFGGIKRRFEYKLRNENCVYIDDYAHHPAEIQATLNAVKELYPGKKILAFFQPHLFSRTQDFAAGFAESLKLANVVRLLPIYPARELPIPGVESQMLADLLTDHDCKVIADEEVLHTALSTKADVYLSMGAGNIDKLVEPLKEALLLKFGTATENLKEGSI